MSICDAPVFVLVQVGDIAITLRSLPPLLFVVVFSVLCAVLTIRKKLYGWRDFTALCAVVSVQSLVIRTGIVPGGVGVSGAQLLGGFSLFLVGYGCWRIMGKPPLQNWPWYRFGLLVTLSVTLTDILVASLQAPPPGGIWQLGGGCYQDALLLGPPILTLLYGAFLVCVTPWTFCSKECVKLGRCRYDCQNGQQETVAIESRASVTDTD